MDLPRFLAPSVPLCRVIARYRTAWRNPPRSRRGWGGAAGKIGARVGFVLPNSVMHTQHRRVGHKGVYARLRRAMGAGTSRFDTLGTRVRRAHHCLAARIDSVGGHGARESLIRIEGRASAFAHPTRPCNTISQKKIGPCLRLWARGRPYFLSSVSLEIEGDGAPTRRSARITPGG